MAAMSAPNGSDFGGVARGSQPVVDGGADLASLHGRFPGSCVTGDEKQDSVPRGDCPVQPDIDRIPGLVEVQPVKIQNPVGLDGSGFQLLVPARIQRAWSRLRTWRQWLGRRRDSSNSSRCARLLGSRNRRGRKVADPFSRKRSDRCCNPLPKRLLVSAERAHGQPNPSGSAPAPGPCRTYRLRSAEPGRRRPKTCRRGCCP